MNTQSAVRQIHADSDVSDKLLGILAEIKKVDPATLSFSPDDDFLTVLNIDSLDSVQLTIRIANVFGFNFGEDIDDIDALESYGKLVQLIETRGRVTP